MKQNRYCRVVSAILGSSMLSVPEASALPENSMGLPEGVAKTLDICPVMDVVISPQLDSRQLSVTNLQYSFLYTTGDVTFKR